MSIGGMSCSFCASTINKAYTRIDGVHEVGVSLAHEEGLIRYDPDKVTPPSATTGLVSPVWAMVALNSVTAVLLNSFGGRLLRGQPLTDRYRAFDVDIHAPAAKH